MSDADRSMSSDGTGPTSDGIRPERVDSRALFMARRKLSVVAEGKTFSGGLGMHLVREMRSGEQLDGRCGR